jgi:hypothetical protein
MFHLLSDRVIRGPHGTGCGRDQTRESLNEARIRVNHLSALSDQFLVCVIPKDGQSLIVQDDLSGRSFLLRGQMSFCLHRVCQKMVDRFLVRVIPKDGQSGQLAYARLLNLNCGRYKKVCLTSSFFPGGRKLVLRCVAYQSTRALERGHLIGVHRRSFWCRALRGHRLCDEACDQLRF